MKDLLAIILDSGKSAIELAIYTLLPILIVMMAVMKLLEARGVLAWVGRRLSPALRVFGIPGIGVFAALQILLVSYAAPASTLAVMDSNGTPRREIAATLAMVLAMSQANAVFPLLASGLSLAVTLLTSIVGGLIAAATTYYWFSRGLVEPDEPSAEDDSSAAAVRLGNLEALRLGGEEGGKLLLQSIPMLVLAIFFLNLLKAVGGVAILEGALSPLLAWVRLPAVSIVPIVTKYLAGGTAMVGVTMKLVTDGTLDAVELNRIAGIMINPLDLVGVTFLVAALERVKSVVKPAIFGAIVGILVRGVIHLALF